MATIVTTFASAENIYIKSGDTNSWAAIRASSDSDTLIPTQGSTTPAVTSIIDPGGQSGTIQFARTYINFDLSSIPSTTTITDIKLALSSVYDVAYENAIIAYGGDILTSTNSDYSLYITSLQLDEKDQPMPLAYINLVKNTLTSSSLDIITYPPSQGKETYGNYVVGLISTKDFTNSTDGGSYDSGWKTYGIMPKGGDKVPQPRLIITYEGGYPNTVIGVAGANISTVAGVPSANISKVMGV